MLICTPILHALLGQNSCVCTNDVRVSSQWTHFQWNDHIRIFSTYSAGGGKTRLHLYEKCWAELHKDTQRCRKGKPNSNYVIIKHNAQIIMRYIFLCLLSRKINSRQNWERTYMLTWNFSWGTTRGGLVCVGDLTIGSSGVPILHCEPVRSSGHDYCTFDASEYGWERTYQSIVGGMQACAKFTVWGAGMKWEVLWDMLWSTGIADNDRVQGALQQ